MFVKLRYWPWHSHEGGLAPNEVWIPSEMFVEEVLCCIDHNWDYEVIEVSIDDYTRDNYGF